MHRAAASLTLLLLSIGCQTAQHRPSAKQSLPAFSQQELLLRVQNPKILALLARATERNRRARADFLQDENKAIDKNNRLAQNRFRDVRRRGGYQQVLTNEIAALDQELRTAAEPRRDNLEDLRSSFASRLKTMGLCSDPQITDVPDRVSPEKAFVLFGCGLGISPGQVFLSGNFPSSPVALQVDAARWTDEMVYAQLPPLSGMIDGPAKIHVVTSSGTPTAEAPVLFYATRDFQYVLEPPALEGTCQGGTHDDWCIQGAAFAHSFIGHHFGGCCKSVSGSDHYRADLKNGWALSSFYGRDVSPPGSDDWHHYLETDAYLSCNPLIADEAQVLGVRGIALRSSVIDINVDWWVGANCSELTYVGRIPIEGPLGVPYQ